MCILVCRCKPEDSLWEFVLSFLVGPRDGTRVIRLGVKGLYQLSHQKEERSRCGLTEAVVLSSLAEELKIQMGGQRCDFLWPHSGVCVCVCVLTPAHMYVLVEATVKSVQVTVRSQ